MGKEDLQVILEMTEIGKSTIQNSFLENNASKMVVLLASYLYKVWFGLVSLFNGISTFVGHLIQSHSPRRKVEVLFNP